MTPLEQLVEEVVEKFEKFLITTAPVLDKFERASILNKVSTTLKEVAVKYALSCVPEEKDMTLETINNGYALCQQMINKIKEI